MWPLPTINNELLSISLNDTALTCSWIQSTKNSTPTMLKAYASYPLNNLEYHNALVFNPTYLTHCIQNFIHQNHLEHAYCMLSISGKSIVEAITTLPIASPQPTDFSFTKLRNLLWDYRYLYPNNNDQFDFYVCGITQSLLVQYQLMAIALPVNLLVITTELMALLNLYKRQYGPTFRHSQLARDMMRHNNDIHQLFTLDTIRRNLAIKPSLSIDIEQEKLGLLLALGLFYAGKDMHATY